MTVALGWKGFPALGKSAVNLVRLKNPQQNVVGAKGIIPSLIVKVEG